jgi:predicted HTH transcriptional regulator
VPNCVSHSFLKQAEEEMTRKATRDGFELRKKGSEKDSEKSTEKTIRLLQRNHRLTIAALSREIGVSTRAIEKTLKRLRDAGRLRRVGGEKAGRWEVLEDGVPSEGPKGKGAAGR